MSAVGGPSRSDGMPQVRLYATISGGGTGKNVQQPGCCAGPCADPTHMQGRLAHAMRALHAGLTLCCAALSAGASSRASGCCGWAEEDEGRSTGARRAGNGSSPIRTFTPRRSSLSLSASRPSAMRGQSASLTVFDQRGKRRGGDAKERTVLRGPRTESEGVRRCRP